MGLTSAKRRHKHETSKRVSSNSFKILNKMVSSKKYNFVPSKKLLDSPRKIRLGKMKERKLTTSRKVSYNDEEEIENSHRKLLSADSNETSSSITTIKTSNKGPIDPFRIPNKTRERKVPKDTSWPAIQKLVELNPDMCTSALFHLSLQNNPPLSFVQFMLSINPNVAQVPTSGMTALQVAIKHKASLEVIEEVIQSFPSALFITNGNCDPLTYAKIWRNEDLRLIELLERSLSFWAKSGTNTSSKQIFSFSDLPSSKKKKVIPVTTSSKQNEKKGIHESPHIPPLHPNLFEKQQRATYPKIPYPRLEGEMVNAKYVETWIKQTQRFHKKQMHLQFETLRGEEARSRLVHMKCMVHLIETHFKTQLTSLEAREKKLMDQISSTQKDFFFKMQDQFDIQKREQEYFHQQMEQQTLSWKTEMRSIYEEMFQHLHKDFHDPFNLFSKQLKNEVMSQSKVWRHESKRMIENRRNFEKLLSQVENLIGMKQCKVIYPSFSSPESDHGAPRHLDSMSYSGSMEDDDNHVDQRDGTNEPIIFVPSKEQDDEEENDYDFTRLLMNSSKSSDTVWTISCDGNSKNNDIKEATIASKPFDQKNKNRKKLHIEMKFPHKWIWLLCRRH